MGRKILVVDDETAIREMIGFVLSGAGFDYVVVNADFATAVADLRRIVNEDAGELRAGRAEIRELLRDLIGA